MFMRLEMNSIRDVAPHAGAWIEMTAYELSGLNPAGRPPHGGVD